MPLDEICDECCGDIMQELLPLDFCKDCPVAEKKEKESVN